MNNVAFHGQAAKNQIEMRRELKLKLRVFRNIPEFRALPTGSW